MTDKNRYSVDTLSASLRMFCLRIFCLGKFCLGMAGIFCCLGVSASAQTPKADTNVVSPALVDSISAVKAGKDVDLTEINIQGYSQTAQDFLLWLFLKSRPDITDIDEAMNFVQSHSHWPGTSSIAGKIERALTQRNSEVPLKSEQAELARAARLFSTFAPRTAEGVMLYARALLAGGQQQQAMDLLRKSWWDIPFDEKAEAEFLENFSRFVSMEDHEKRLERLIRTRQADAAMRQARLMGDNYILLTDAQIKLAFRKSGVDEAIRKVPASLQGDPGLIYERAKWKMKTFGYQNASPLLFTLFSDEEINARFWPLRHSAARQAADDQNWEQAYEFYTRHGLTSGVGFAEAEFNAGWTALKQLGKPDLAYTHFTTLFQGVRTPISRARGAYWAGEAALAKGALHDAVEWYQEAAKYNTAFYGQMALNRLGDQKTISLSQSATHLNLSERKAFETQDLVQVIHLLDTFQLKDYIPDFFAALRRRAQSERDLELIAQLALSLSDAHQVIKTAKAAQYQGHLFTAHLFPVPFFDTGEDEHAALVAAVARQESEFNASVVSHAGAIGLMQLMPATARGVSKKQGLAYNKARLASDPSYNAKLGRAYLLSLLARFDNNYILTLAAYNAGPSRANRWIEEYGDPRHESVDPITWIESVPFEETKNYIMRVLEGVTVYQEIFDHHMQKSPIRLASLKDLDIILPNALLQIIDTADENP